jgi:lipoprotein-anchoring transpeptidase ErfK/SrfK
MTLEARFGASTTPTRKGTFNIFLKSKNHFSTLYDTPMPYAMFFSGGQAVHYSPDFAARGYNGASHGCVNIRDMSGVRKLFAKVSVGTKVVVYS